RCPGDAAAGRVAAGPQGTLPARDARHHRAARAAAGGGDSRGRRPGSIAARARPSAQGVGRPETGSRRRRRMVPCAPLPVGQGSRFMILRGLLIEHWRCIARLELTDLPLGVLILHAPNRTGKSSLVKALRSCLYDHDHDTTRQEVVGAIPWNSKHTPRVAVTFETGGQVYRITKVYSRKKAGGALLEKRSGDRWLEHVREPKEAARETRKLLGAEKSDCSLNQLLWLDQGQIHLPEARKLDVSLEKRLEEVLGTLVTGRDLDFKKTLDRRCDRWVTPRR